MIQDIPLTLLQPDSRNANVCDMETMAKLRRNIERNNWYPPLIVRPAGEAYIIIDGHHRKIILEDLGHSSATCQVYSVDEKEAGLLLVTLNRLRGTDNPYQRAELLANLKQVIPDEELLGLIPESSGEMKDLLSLLEINQAEREEALRRHLESEKAVLPVSLGFLLTQEQAATVESALKKAGSTDRAQTLTAIAKAYLEGNDGHTS